jgi:hypothetical protein
MAVIFRSKHRTMVKMNKNNLMPEAVASWDIKKETKGKKTLEQIIAMRIKKGLPVEGIWSNGFYFRMKDGENYTDMIIDGKVIHDKHSYGSYGICVLPDGSIKFDHFNTVYKHFLGGIKAMHHGVRPTYIGSNKLLYRAPKSNSHKKNPNIAIGINSKNEFCVVSFDGRRSWLSGSTFNQVVEFMRDAMDCEDILILDGGGSVQLAYVDANGNIKYLNSPCGRKPYRPVANWLYFQEKEKRFVDVRKIPTLRKGMKKSNHVKVLQKFLNDNGYHCGRVDGWFGTKTKTALLKYQLDVRYNRVIGKFDVDGLDGQFTKGERYFEIEK